MRSWRAVGVCVALAGCGGGSSSSQPAPSADPEVAIIVERYGDCLTAIGDRLDGEVLPESTDEHTYVGFHGRHAVVFSVTHVKGKVYTVPDDRVSAQRLSKGGATC